jgi:malto-oligosyltrehalose trehalohydrolase
MKRRHDMPFGAALQDDGSVRFRLWAPSVKRVDLKLGLGGPGQLLPMKESGDGWFELTTKEARPGTRYLFVLDEGMAVPDPASRDQGGDVHGWSIVVDPHAFEWHDDEWRGRPWHEAVLYELHVGSFTRSGRYYGVAQCLDDLIDLGITAIELMPLAEAPGRHNWGYDGVYLFAPDSAYGQPDDLKLLIETAHRRGLMVFIDVVYNHFGPDGNYLASYAKPFFTEKHHTPWGAAINYDAEQNAVVRDFMVHNALYWLEEYNADGLRLDAVHAIADTGRPHILQDIASTVHRKLRERQVHLVLENDDNAAWLLRKSGAEPDAYDAQWNDDVHHALHAAVTGQGDGYYSDYKEPIRHLGRALTEGFAYQGEPSHHRDGKKRGEPSVALPLTRFVSFLQNHDQVGNSATGLRIHHTAPLEAVRAAAAVYLLAPSPPLVFMGEEWAASTPFLFFCDYGGSLADSVREGRRAEFKRFAEFQDAKARERIPDPNAASTFLKSRLNWSERERTPHREILALYRDLLAIRHRDIVPRLAGIKGNAGTFSAGNDGGLTCTWTLGDGYRLHLRANLTNKPAEPPGVAPARKLFASHGDAWESGALPAWSVYWSLQEPSA